MKKLLSRLFFFFILTLVVQGCKKEESFDIDNLKEELKADFSADKQRVYLNQPIQFKNESHGATSYQWTFEGGEPSVSSDENPKVLYAKDGKYRVSLEVRNGEENKLAVKEEYITVFSEACWSEFVYPEIIFKNTAANGNGALYNRLVPSPDELIHGVCLDVCRLLYMSPEEMDVVEKISYTVEDNDGVSAKGGQPPHISIVFSSKYLKSCESKGMSDAELMAEIKGVLYHEVTHGYQFSPRGAGEYKAGDDFFGFIEGMADYVRYLSGYLTTDDRKAGGHWNDGYKNSAFFMDWLHSKDPSFLYKLNQSAKTINPWSWEKATQRILNTSVSALWTEYQNDLTTGKITEIDQLLKEQREF
ncbi:PKD domain-containing protein [Marinilabiliaceae bacterium JC017]|nr:PKD domain-containing protein [Marinilabiliaceae bacterium JC017]